MYFYGIMGESIKGELIKMKSELRETVHYHLSLGRKTIHLNDLLGQKLRVEYQGEIYCIRCGKKTNKSFAQGYCYSCFRSAPETSECVLRPELCRAHEGISRDMEWSQQHCLQDHYVYLAISSGLKVGVTRSSQVPVRWIDQGAGKAIRLARTPNRYTAGLIEVALKEYLNDKTNWRKMLTGNMDQDIDLSVEKSLAAERLSGEHARYVIPDDEIVEISYPVLFTPEKIASINFDREPAVEGTLSGIKGQYLLFNTGQVLNIRKHNGYRVEIHFLV